MATNPITSFTPIPNAQGGAFRNNLPPGPRGGPTPITSFQPISGGAPAGQAPQGGDWTDFLPAAGGIGGSIIGTLTAGPGLGTIAGGAGGQGLFEGLRQLIKGKGLDVGKIAGETAQGGVFGAIPGGEEVKGLSGLLKLGARGAAGGAAIQGIQNIESGKPVTENIGQSAGIMGTLNAISPIFGKMLGKVAETVIPDAKKLMSNIEVDFLGQKLAKDPELTKYLDYTSAMKSLDNMKTAQQEIYKPVNEALASIKKENMGDYLEALQKGLKADLVVTPEKRAELFRSAQEALARSSNDPAVVEMNNEVTRLLDSAGRGSLSGGRAAATKRFMLAQAEKLQEQLMTTPVSGTAIGKVQRSIVENWYKAGAENAYREGRIFIEDMVGNKAPVKQINSLYERLREAISHIDKNFSGKDASPSMGKGFGLSDRAGINAVGTIAAAALGGVPTAITAPLILADLLKKELSMNPDTATKLAQMLLRPQELAQPLTQNAGKALPGTGLLLNKLLNQNQQQ